MSDTPKVGDKVRVSYEGVVSEGTTGTQVWLDNHTAHLLTRAMSVEILERADGPSRDPVGTVRRLKDGRIAVKTVEEYYPWQFIEDPGYTAGLNGCADGGFSLAESEIIGAVPGTPAAKAASAPVEPEYEYYRGHHFDVPYRLKGHVVEFYADGDWLPSAADADEVREEDRWTKLDGKPSDVD